MLKQRSVHWYGIDESALSESTWRSSLRSCIHFIDKLSIGVAVFAAICCFALAVLTCVLVALGAVNIVHNGFEELKWHLCGTVFMLSGAYCLERNAHVRVDTFFAKFSSRWQAIVDMLGILLFVLPFAVMITINGLDIALDALSRSESSNDAGGLPYRWIIKSVIPLGFFLLTAQSLAVFARAFLAATLNPAAPTTSTPEQVEQEQSDA